MDIVVVTVTITYRQHFSHCVRVKSVIEHIQTETENISSDDDKRHRQPLWLFDEFSDVSVQTNTCSLSIVIFSFLDHFSVEISQRLLNKYGQYSSVFAMIYSVANY